MARGAIHVLPQVVPEGCEWVDDAVLGAKSVVDEEFIKYFCQHHRYRVGSVEGKKYRVIAPGPEDRACYVDPEGESCIFLYEPIFTKVGIRVPFSEFKIGVLNECEIAPSQIHPNSWGFIRAYEIVCHEFGFPTSLGVFFYLFKLTKPFSKDKQQWLSLRAHQSKRSAAAGGSNSGVSKSTSPEVILPTSTSVLDSESGKDTSATLSPSTLSAQEVDNSNRDVSQTRKRKTFEPKYGPINSKEFDHVGFAQEYLVGGNNKIPMDGENFMKNLEFVTRSSIKAAAICQAAQNKLKGCVVVPEGEVEVLRSRVRALETEKKVIEGEKFDLSSKVTNLEARIALEAQEVDASKVLVKRLEKEKADGEEKYRRLYAEFKMKIENQKRLETELQAAQDLCDKFSDDALMLAEEVAQNLKEQVQVLLPEFDVKQIGPDFKVVDGVIIRPESVADEQVHPEKPVGEGSEQVPASEGSPVARPAMSDPPPTPPCPEI
ncbi:hypothetical protein PIB30_098097 [Stylosanthes scabra]|uniref:Transposase (putative) gypsy type domain-containing protein n=1 Tax=Stylosanthes scabra TaxID=79078 RepID=A0ABU6YYA9_9FABA|nr:hypothetical protein [Stylosanthes scabra]